MAKDQTVAPVIIKRKKIIVADGHHGGAWKVAYADFVTAMMAFFMLMWLLNATTEQKKKGIADYFSRTLAINRSSGGGDSSFVGDTVFTKETLTRPGVGASTIYPTESAGSRGANVEHGSYKAILVPYNEDDPLQNMPVYSFQKLIEAAQGTDAATLTLESGETIAPQKSIALR